MMHLTKKQRQLLYALAIAALTLLAMFLLAQLAFGGNELKLSSNAACMAVQPRVAKADPWIAAVWIEDNGDEECSAKGNAMLRAAQYDTGSETYSWWAAPFVVENGSSSTACVTHADVAIKDGVAHIVIAKRRSCAQPQSSLYYRTCDLTNRSCEEHQYIAQTGVGNSATDVNITVDANGKPHVVYGTASNNPPNGEIYYTYKNGVSWPETTTNLSITSTEMSTDYPAYHPRIAWNNNRLHVVWDGQIETGNGVPIYRYCNADGTCPTEGGPYNLEDSPWDTQGMGTDAKPVVAAQGNRVLVAWQYCSHHTDSTCDNFQIYYKYSDSNGSAGTFITQTQALGGGQAWHGTAGGGYPSTDATQAGDYASQLNPALALGTDQNPIFTWQQFNAVTPTRMMITTTIGTTPTTGGGFTGWRHPYGWAIGTDDRWDTRVRPAILLPSYSSPLTPSLHLFYMKKGPPGSYDYRIDYLYLEEGVIPSAEEEPTVTGSPSATEVPGGSKVYLPLVNRNFGGE
ncbi:MAG: hypothetical protein U9Q70_10755 [Chloroflexota bacterium]|nr:hypothetical protein [Chloroflexota bacterium]